MRNLIILMRKELDCFRIIKFKNRNFNEIESTISIDDFLYYIQYNNPSLQLNQTKFYFFFYTLPKQIYFKNEKTIEKLKEILKGIY